MTVRRTRAELAAEVAGWRANGLPTQEVAELLGISRSYAYDLVCDPSGIKGRARKDSYGETCTRCGARTTGCNGRARAPTRCAACAARESPIGEIGRARRGAGSRGLAALAFLSDGERRFSDIREQLGIPSGQLGSLLSRLHRYGLIEHVRRGYWRAT